MNTFLLFLPLIIVTIILVGFGGTLIIDDTIRSWKQPKPHRKKASHIHRKVS